MTVNKEGDLEVWWQYERLGQHYNERIPVKNIKNAMRIIDDRANSQMYDDTIDFNCGGLEVYDGNEWSEWYDDDGYSIDDLMERNG